MKKLKYFHNHAVMPSIISYPKRIMISQSFIKSLVRNSALYNFHRPRGASCPVSRMICFKLLIVYNCTGRLMEDFMIILVGDQLAQCACNCRLLTSVKVQVAIYFLTAIDSNYNRNTETKAKEKKDGHC